MKKGCLFAAVAVLLLLGIAAITAAIVINGKVGYTEAPEIRYETRLPEAARLVAVLRPERARDYLVGLLPAQPVQWPAYLPFNLHEAVEYFMPREIAFGGGADYRKGVLALEVFINERRGGPAFVAASQRRPVLREIPRIQWSQPEFALEERGVIRAQGTLPLPQDAEIHVLDRWQPKRGNIVRALPREHLLEAVLDNHDGDAMAMAGAIGELHGVTLSEIFSDPTAREMVSAMDYLLVHADLTGPDELTVTAELVLVPDHNPALRFMAQGGIGMGFPIAQRWAQENLGLRIEFKDGIAPLWVDDRRMRGAYVVTGFRERLDQAIARYLPAARPGG